METFKRLGGKSDGEIPTALLCGDDLRRARDPPSPVIAVPVVQTAVSAAQLALVAALRQIYHSLFRPSTKPEGGTAATSVQAAIVAAVPSMPSYIASLPVETFANQFLGAGDGGVPPLRVKGYTVADGQRRRVSNVLHALPR